MLDIHWRQQVLDVIPKTRVSTFFTKLITAFEIIIRKILLVFGPSKQNSYVLLGATTTRMNIYYNLLVVS